MAWRNCVAWLGIIAAIGLHAEAEAQTVRGRVVDGDGKPVKGADIATLWLEGQPVEGATTGEDGSFELALRTPGRATGVLIRNEARTRGVVSYYDPSSFDEERTLKLKPLVKVHGKFSCDELGPPPMWTNVYANLTPSGVRVDRFSSKEARFEFLLPPGRFELYMYGTDTKTITQSHTIAGDEKVVDLGTIDLPATALAKLYGKKAPEWSVSAARGMTPSAKLSDFRGKHVLLEFWGYWCGPCVRRGLPELMEFHDEFADRQNDFEILAFHDPKATTLEQLDAELVRIKADIWGGRDLPFPILLDDSGKTIQDFGIKSFPTLVVIDPDGKIVRHGGIATVRNALLEASPAYEALVKSLGNARSKKKLQKALREVLKTGGDVAGLALYNFAKDGLKKSQSDPVTETMDELGGRYAVSYFLGDQGLRSEKKATRLAAIEALRRHAERRLMFTLSDRANEEKDEEVKKALFELLQELNERPE